jgi:hypothetical protein
MKFVRLGLVIAALIVAVMPVPARFVEAWYSRGVYLSIQSGVTTVSNTVPIALLDVAAVCVLVALVFLFWRRTRIGGVLRAALTTTLTLTTLAAVVYLAFVVLWGLNYRRLPLEGQLAFDESRVTQDGVRLLGQRAARILNATHAAALASPQGAPLDSAFGSAQALLGSSRFAVPGIPKRSALELYFRRAAIDGMTDPIFLEVILNPDTLPHERPFVTLHEWAHLAGYAHEAEASFVAWLACSRGDALMRYSGWFAIYEHVLASLPRTDRAALGALLDRGPKEDLRQSAARYARSSPVVRDTAREVYDTYLRANRVKEGIASYTGVVRLMVGAGVDEDQAPRLRPAAH